MKEVEIKKKKKEDMKNKHSGYGLVVVVYYCLMMIVPYAKVCNFFFHYLSLPFLALPCLMCQHNTVADFRMCCKWCR